MPLINYKFEFNLEKANHFVLSAPPTDTDDANSNNFIFTISGTKIYVPVVTLSAKIMENYQNFFGNGLKDRCF